MTVLHSSILVPSLWRVFPITLSSQTDMPSLTTVTLTKGWAFYYKKNTHTKSISPSSPSFLDITSALSRYLFSLSFTPYSSIPHSQTNHILSPKTAHSTLTRILPSGSRRQPFFISPDTSAHSDAHHHLEPPPKLLMLVPRIHVAVVPHAALEDGLLQAEGLTNKQTNVFVKPRTSPFTGGHSSHALRLGPLGGARRTQMRSSALGVLPQCPRGLMLDCARHTSHCESNFGSFCRGCPTQRSRVPSSVCRP